MRALKFRAWSKKRNKWWEGVWIKAETGSTYTGDTHDLELDANDDLIVEQFTGLKDMNGKEVYEGDIIKYDHPNSGYGRTDIPDYCFDPVPALETMYEDGEHCEMIFRIRSGEVVGNIHQNHELMLPETKS